MIPWRVICWWVPAAAVPGGRWIPYGAAAVRLHRAARLVCVVVGMGAGEAAWAPPAVPAYEHFPPALGTPLAYDYPPSFFVPGPGEFPPETFAGAPQPQAFAETPPRSDVGGVPEPTSLAVLALGVVVLVGMRR